MAQLDWGLLNTDPGEAQRKGFAYAQAIQQAAQQKQARQAKLEAGGQYAAGDYSGASQTLARSGDIPGAETVRQSEIKGNTAGIEYLGKSAATLKDALQKGGPQLALQVFDHIAPEVPGRTGASPQAISQFRMRLAADPEGAIGWLQNQLDAHYEKIGNTLVRRQGDAVTPVFTGQKDAPSGYEYGPDGHSLSYIPGGPGDPKTVGSLANERRMVIVNNPIPQQVSPQQTLKNSVQLRKEFDQLPDVKDFHDVANSYDIIADIARRPPTAQNDLSLIFAYMKMLDPVSVVREGEFANAQNTAGIPDQIRNMYNRALNGQRLNDNQRREFTNTAGGVYQSRKRRYDQIVAQYQGYARDSGLGENVIQPRIPAGDGGGQGAAIIPDAAKAYLKKNPGAAQQFDQKYGKGSAAKVLGS